MVDVRDPLELFSESDIANLLAKELRQNLRRVQLFSQGKKNGGSKAAAHNAYQKQR